MPTLEIEDFSSQSMLIGIRMCWLHIKVSEMIEMLSIFTLWQNVRHHYKESWNYPFMPTSTEILMIPMMTSILEAEWLLMGSLRHHKMGHFYGIHSILGVTFIGNGYLEWYDLSMMFINYGLINESSSVLLQCWNIIIRC